MWKEPDPDPGGESHSTAQTSRELTELKDQNEQQELMIAQLKEMLRKEQSNVPQEKVEEYINTLSKIKAKRTRLKRDEAGSKVKHTSSNDSNKNEKVNLLKQQMEENKAKLAERGLREKGIEEMVTILKAQFNDSQQLIDSTSLSTYDKNLEYNKNTSQDELYNILLVKEKKITDFMEKNRKQEATILDLQENLKEKDSVIDARTKAITLMSDSLSKKSKDSLDALDETRDQMRKMQEDFVKLESEMKARQMKLLEDLKSKNIEIAELQKYNKQLVEQKSIEKREEINYENLILNLQEKLDQTLLRNNQQVDEIKELEKKLQDSLADIDRLKSAGISMETVENSDKEVTKLKKQLDESNKNMIKIKAQSKSKVKELTKKIESFKKVSDANALIVQLQNEITKLNEKIAELEEEKGNMQLKMVESAESIKDESQLEENRALQEKLANSFKDLEEKDKIISFLECEILSLKDQISSLNEKIADFSHLKNVQVTSDIESIQIEEQLDNLESENKKLQKVIDELTSQKHDLIEKFEDVTREKQELNAKLDNYIQENMDLIDKLEKLSAEKVSSAESIEIVEGLTQQEKLELAAYQQTIGVLSDDSAKCPEDDNGDHPPELNESVLQLNEDSTELLNKIEMFNMERKEVMVKLEALRDENNRLSLKLNEVENNRDILAETYEQLQNEKEELQKENEELTGKVGQAELVVGVKENNENSSMSTKFQGLETKYEKILNENERLKQKLKDFDTKIHEKDNLETKLSESKIKIENLETNIKMHLEEIDNYQTVIEENKVELINSAKVINELQSNLNEKERDIKELNVLMNDLNNVVSDLQKENVKLANFEIMDKQVNELKTALSEQIEVAEAKEQQYKEENLKTKEFLTNLESRYANMNYQLFETLQELEKRNEEIATLKQSQLEKDHMINTLKNQKQEEDQKISVLIEEMRQKYLRLQTQLDGNNDSLEKKVEELSNKNKEQLEKMKKIAANLKKKSQAYSKLEEKYTEEKEKWEIEINKKESDASDKITSLLREVENLTEEVSKKTKHIEESEFRLKELTDIIDNLEQQKADLQNSLLELKHKQDKLSELSLKQELSTSLHEEFDNLHGNNASTYEDKIQELELINETNESELFHFRERVQKLEEDMSHLLEEKVILEQKASTIEEKLFLTSKIAEEKAQLGEELTNKISELTANNAVFMKRLGDIEEENKNLNEKSREQEELIIKLKVKLKKAHEKVTELKTIQSSMEELENANVELKKQSAHLETLLKHAHEENEEMRNRNQNDYEKIECDYQLQLGELVTCKNELTIECEKLQEALKNSREKEEEFLSEMADYKQKLHDVENEHETKILQLTQELKAANNNWRTALEEINEVKHQLFDTQKQIIIQTAQAVVEDVVTEATERVCTINSKETQTEIDNGKKTADSVTENEPKILQTFAWPEAQERGHNHDCLGNVETPQETEEFLRKDLEQRVTVTKEDMQNKIKALEVLLYNVDKEKEAILDQCSGMLSELTHLVYEKINAHNSGTSRYHPNSRILAPSDLESEIVSCDDIDAFNDKKILQKIEFEKSFPSSGQQNVAVIEEVLQPKKAYLTYQAGAEAFGENDDGWGWGPEEAKLEEEHQYQAESTPQVQALRLEIGRLNEKLQVFQKERENHLEEMKQLQVKSGKLIKKCRELKQKNDQLSLQKTKKPDNSHFFDLEQTIQEELKSQITSLEKRIKELHTELDKERIEKTNILKRVDVLSSANEKMVEMKEIQDSEVLRWKRKYEEIEEKLQQQKWAIGDNEGTKEKQSVEVETSNQNTEELQQMIKELALDNEELQILLNEQRQLRIEAEKNKNSARTEKEFLKVTEEFEGRLKLFQQEMSEKSTEFHDRLEEKDEMVTMLQGELKIKEDVIQSLEENVRYLNESNNELRISLENNIAIANQASSNNWQQLEERCCQLDALLTEKSATADQLKSSHDQTVIFNVSLEKQVENLTISLENIKQKYNDLQTTSLDHIEKLQNELEAQRKNSSQMNPDETNPVVQQLTNHTANTLLELFEKFCSANLDYENLKVLYKEAVDANKSTGDAINEVQQELFDLKREFSELQNSSSKSILDLQNELMEQKQKFDQLQTEKSIEIKRLETQLLEEQQKNEKIPEPLSDGLIEKISSLESLLATKEERIIQLQSVVDDLHKQRAILDEDMKVLKNHLNKKQMELDSIVKEMEEKFTNTVAELEKKWEVQVDERGNTVAESWKYHLNMVESEFAVVQEKLKNEINELEEKCNALVNENNELRKNVDTEIKNEVNRTSAMQQQINDSQKAVKELTERLGEEQIAKLTLGEQMANLEQEKIGLQNSLTKKEFELSSLKVIIETTQKQFDEKREVLEEIVMILEKSSPWPLSCEKKDVLNELRRQLNTTYERDEEIKKLNAHISVLQSHANNLSDKDKEIVSLNNLVSELKTQLEQVKEKNQGLLEESQTVEQMQKQLCVLQEKESEVAKLKTIIEEYKVQSDKNHAELDILQHDKTEALHKLENYKQKFEELKLSNDYLQSSAEEKNQQIESLKHLSESLKHAEEGKEKVETEMSQFRNDFYSLQQSLTESQQQLYQANQDLVNKAYELENMNQQLAYSQNNVEILETELNRLRELLDAKQTEFMKSLEEVKQHRFVDLENHYQEILSSKDIDIQAVRAQLSESVSNANEFSEKFNQELSEKDELQKQLQEKINEQNALLEEENNQLSELRGIIEQQVIKIEQLKEELFQKSNDYDSIIAEMDMSRKAITQQPTSQNENPVASSSPRSIPEEDLSEPVNRAELDLALYMLHQRDVRCEELLVELALILEERDTLQLRLSNALRENEEIRRKVAKDEQIGGVEMSLPSPSSIPFTGLSGASANFPASSDPELKTESQETPSGNQILDSKLSELKRVGYKRDKTFVDEQQLRRYQQMSIMQQHISEASKLPPEAQAKLVDASYTLSRDVQSPSKVLLNWLWGNSTPKENES